MMLMYLDDIMGFSKSLEADIEHAWHVLQVLLNAGTMMKLTLCEFILNMIDYLSHSTRPGKLAVLQLTIDRTYDL